MTTTFLYETIPQKPGDTPVRFEVLQSRRDPPLLRHPATGQPVRRVDEPAQPVLTKACRGGNCAR